jgi:hypothetical protein
MAIEFHCTSCQQKIRVADAAAGKRGKCPHCAAAVQVPSAAAPTASQPAAATITFACPGCQRTINAPASLAGKKVKCPHCQSVLVVGSGQPAAPQSTPSPSGLQPLGGADDLFADLPAAPQLAPAPLSPASNPLGYTPSAAPLGAMPGPNPYASPNPYAPATGYGTPAASGQRAPLKLMIPAIAMIAIAVLTIGAVAVTGLNAFFTPVPDRFAGPDGGTAYRIGQLIGFVFSVLINIGVIAGGVQMIRLRGFDTARGGAVAACVPLCSLLCLNMPFGIWALIVLYQPDVKRLFR